MEGREKWLKLIKNVRQGDRIVFDSVSRMSRDAEEGFTAYEELYHRGIDLVFLKEPHINTSVYKKAMESGIEMTGTTVDYILEGVNKYMLALTFSDNRIKEYSMDELGSIDLAYATTIHKSQGSEFDCVIIPVLSTFYVMLQRALIYTAITRAKKKVILVGQKRALFTAVHRNDTIQRNTILSKRIRDMFEKMKQKEQKAVKQEEVEQLTL